jgi:apyrase
VRAFSTAGLRTLQAGVAEDILESCRALLHQSAVFRFESHWARIIPGKDEGVYGWLAANYLERRLHAAMEATSATTQAGADTIGVLEMGGASLQISFVPQSLDDVSRDELVPVRLRDRTFWLYTHSYLAYGLEQAQTLLLQRLSGTSTTAPCYNKGYRFHEVDGSGSLAQCVNLMHHLFRKDGGFAKKHKCGDDWSHCTFDRVYQPRIRT